MTPRSVQIWFQNRRQRLKPTQPKQSGVGQAIGGGHCLTLPPTRTSAGSTLGAQAFSMATQRSGRQLPAALPPNFSMAGLAAATGAALANGAAAGSFESLVLGHAMNQLQHNAALAAAGQAAAAAVGSSKYGGLPAYDVMEPFAATKALLGAGYAGGAGANPLAAALSPRNPPPAGGAPLGATPGATALAGAAALAGCMPNAFLAACMQPPAGPAPAAVSETPAPPASTDAVPEDAAAKKEGDANGLLMLLACADGPRKAPVASV